MKAFLLFCGSILLLSCGTERIQLVKTDYEKREVIQVSEAEVAEISEASNSITTSQIEEPIIVNSEDNLSANDLVSVNNPRINQEEPIEDETMQKVKSALKAEHRARSSRNALITSTATLPVTFIFPPIFILSLIFFIIGAIKLSGANNSRYITPDGERYISSAKIFLTISAVIITIIMLLTALLLVLFFL